MSNFKEERISFSPFYATKVFILFSLIQVSFLNCQSEPKKTPEKVLTSDTCIEGNCINGFGTKQFQSGRVYTGNFRDGKPNGKGKEEFQNFQYEGDFLNDEQNGIGKFTFPDGATFVGGFKNGDIDGKGILTKPDGGKLEGTWVKNQLTGTVKSTLPNGTVYTGPFVNNAPEGLGEEEYPNGIKYIGEWLNGLRHGKGVMVDTRGTILVEGIFEKGRIPINYINGTPSDVLIEDVNKFIKMLEKGCNEIENEMFLQYGEENGKKKQVWIFNVCNRGVGYFIDLTPDSKGGTFFAINFNKSKFKKKN